MPGPGVSGGAAVGAPSHAAPTFLQVLFLHIVNFEETKGIFPLRSKDLDEVAEASE